jgi:hypothetical protein
MFSSISPRRSLTAPNLSQGEYPSFVPLHGRNIQVIA